MTRKASEMNTDQTDLEYWREQAENRVSQSETLKLYWHIIFAKWGNPEDHYKWIITHRESVIEAWAAEILEDQIETMDAEQESEIDWGIENGFCEYFYNQTEWPDHDDLADYDYDYDEEEYE